MISLKKGITQDAHVSVCASVLDTEGEKIVLEKILEFCQRCKPTTRCVHIYM